MAGGLIAPLERLTEQFQRLPGIGRKTAMRLAFCVLDFSEEEATQFADAILEAKRGVKYCSQCQNISVDEVCPICADEGRDRSVICVVEDVKAVMAMERVKGFHGVYHVLHGTISPMDGIGPEQLKIRELLSRVSTGEVAEVILATNPTIEGDATAMYLTGLLKPFGITLSRLAYGVPVGGELDYADEMTLTRAIEGRRVLSEK